MILLFGENQKRALQNRDCVFHVDCVLHGDCCINGASERRRLGACFFRDSGRESCTKRVLHSCMKNTEGRLRGCSERWQCSTEMKSYMYGVEGSANIFAHSSRPRACGDPVIVCGVWVPKAHGVLGDSSINSR